MRPTLLLCLLLVSCDTPPSTKTYSGPNFDCSYPRTWKVVANHDDPEKASVEFDFPGPGFATVMVFKRENRDAFERYTQIAAKKFPTIHERDNPGQKVTTISICKKEKLGRFEALQSTFSVLVAPNHQQCTFTCVDLTSPEMVALIDVFDEGTPLSAEVSSSLEHFITTITPRSPKGEQSAPSNGDKPSN